MKRRNQSIAIAVLIASSMISGLNSANADDAVISVVHSQTGAISFVGVPAVRAMRLAVDDLNSKNFLGNDKLVLDVQDDGSVQAQTVTLINRAAIQTKALIVLGPSASPLALAVGKPVNDLKIPTVTTAQSLASLNAGPWMLKITTDISGAIEPLADYALKRLNLKRIAAVHMSDSDGHVGITKIFVTSVEKGGVKLLANEGVLSTDTDFSALATKIAAMDPDGLFLGVNSVQAANVVVQLKRAGVRSDLKIFGAASLGSDYIRAGGSAVNDTYITIDYDPDSHTPYNKTFVEAYEKAYKVPPENYSGVGYDSVVVAAHAIKAAGPNPTREKVREAFMALKEIPVLMGSGRWNQKPNRVPDYGIVVALIKGGRIVAAP